MGNKVDFGQQVLRRFCEAAPLAVMAQQTLEQLFAVQPLDDLFAAHAEVQYTRTLTFGACVGLMGEVVLRFQPSVRRAHAPHAADLGVTLQAVYDKLAGIEPGVCAALVRASAARARAVHLALGTPPREPLRGHRIRIVDANHLAATHRRVKALRKLSPGPRPGFGVVVYEPGLDLPIAVLPCEDAYVQERALHTEVLTLVAAGDCWLGDRAFCTAFFLGGLAARRAVFLVREHANAPVRVTSPRRHLGTSATGEVFEEAAVVTCLDGTDLVVRRLLVRLTAATRDGDRELVLLTTVDADIADAVMLADLYHTRWRIETAFQRLAELLRTEIDTLGYPRAALFGFAVGLVAYMLVSVVQGALAAAHGAAVVDELSWYQVTTEVQTTHGGMVVAVPDEVWAPYRTMDASTFAACLLALAAVVPMPRYRKARARTKTTKEKAVAPRTVRTRYRGRPHVSTFRILHGLPQRSS